MMGRAPLGADGHRRGRAVAVPADVLLSEGPLRARAAAPHPDGLRAGPVRDDRRARHGQHRRELGAARLAAAGRRAGQAVRRVHPVGLRRGAGEVGGAGRRRLPLGRVRRAARRRRLRRRGRARLRDAGEPAVRRPPGPRRRLDARAVRGARARAVRRDDGVLRGTREVRSRRQAVARSRALPVRADLSSTAATTTRFTAVWERTSGSRSRCCPWGYGRSFCAASTAPSTRHLFAPAGGLDSI